MFERNGQKLGSIQVDPSSADPRKRVRKAAEPKEPEAPVVDQTPPAADPPEPPAQTPPPEPPAAAPEPAPEPDSKPAAKKAAGKVALKSALDKG